MDLYNSANFGDILEWFTVALGMWAAWSGGVTGVVENLKPRYNEIWGVIGKVLIAMRLPAEVVDALRKGSIGLLVVVAAGVFADGGYDLFASFPGQIMLDGTLLTAINAILLAAGAFFLHNRDILSLFGFASVANFVGQGKAEEPRG